MACMTIKITKKALISLLGDTAVKLKTFTGISWAQDNMVLKTRRSLFMGSIVVNINWPCESAKHVTNRESLNKALLYLFAQCDQKYIDAILAEKAKAAPAPAAAAAAPAAA